MLFRPQRGGLSTAMREVREFDGTWEGLQALIQPHQLESVKSYGFDGRIGWDTYIVVAKDWGAAGFTNGPVDKPLDISGQ